MQENSVMRTLLLFAAAVAPLVGGCGAPSEPPATPVGITSTTSATITPTTVTTTSATIGSPRFSPHRRSPFWGTPAMGTIPLQGSAPGGPASAAMGSNTSDNTPDATNGDSPVSVGQAQQRLRWRVTVRRGPPLPP
jgi:hypothetical protein